MISLIFDCDSTFSLVEELARLAGQESEIAALTKRAMDGDIPLGSVYERRMITMMPTRVFHHSADFQFRNQRVQVYRVRTEGEEKAKSG